MKNLVIVESPAKAKTIEKFLGPDYKVMSSYGHIRDLRKKNFSIDIDHGFSPIYEIPDDKEHVVSELRKAASKADMVWLASDEDREGEAIAWHLYEVLGLKPQTTRRIVFHEITKPAILHAISNPRGIDMGRVDAQQARRVLDRIGGFELSPVLWKKIKPSLSAGRVQSVAVRLICERENEIRSFECTPYYRVSATLAGAGQPFRAELSARLADKDAARRFLSDCHGAELTVGDVTVRPLKKSPAPPFTTSTLQQEASRKLGFTVAQTMMVAQRLYEAGHITYMRTDSLNLSAMAINAIKEKIRTDMGERYIKVRNYHTTSKGAQEAHEAIRPTYFDHATLTDGTVQEKRLYSLIYKRAIASQMADAEIEKTTAEVAISSRSEHFTAMGEVIKFDGFLKVYIEGHDDDTAAADGDTSILPPLAPGDKVSATAITATERFTQQPPRYTEASLVKKLEELGIGRPSTYAPTISTIQQREYIEKGVHEGVKREFCELTLQPSGAIKESERSEMVGSDKGKLIPTDTGMVVNEFLTRYFPKILDYNFTANVEEKFDAIAEGSLPWADQIRLFYNDFHPDVENAKNMRLEHRVGERQLGVDPKTGQPVSVKIGRFGPLVQIGTGDGDQKPRFASLLKGQSMSEITLDEALRLFDFPRVIGEYEGKDLTVGIGRFGPYVRHDGKYVSIPKTMEPAAVTADEAIELIRSKRDAEAKKVVKTFAEDAEVQILNGRYGVYIAAHGANYKLPRGIADPAALSFEEVMQIVDKQAAAAKDTPKRTTASRKK